jgi:STE24 endopeptidase
LANTTTE